MSVPHLFLESHERYLRLEYQWKIKSPRPSVDINSETLHDKQNTQQNFFELVPNVFLPPFTAENSISSIMMIATPSRHRFPNAQDKGYDATSVHVYIKCT